MYMHISYNMSVWQFCLRVIHHLSLYPWQQGRTLDKLDMSIREGE